MWEHDISYILIHARRLLIQGDIVALCDMAETLTQYDKPELMLDFVKMCNYMNRVKCLDLIAGVDEVIPETDCCC